MNKSIVAGLFVVLSIFCTSCIKERLIELNGVVKVEFIKAPTSNQSVILGSEEELVVRLTSREDDVLIKRANIKLFIQDPNDFTFFDNGRIEKKEDLIFSGEPENDDDLIFNKEFQINDLYHEFDTIIDFSSYPKGMVFGLIVAHEDTYAESGGTFINHRYFRKKI